MLCVCRVNSGGLVHSASVLGQERIFHNIKCNEASFIRAPRTPFILKVLRGIAEDLCRRAGAA